MAPETKGHPTEQLPSSVNNRGLFSDYYLTELVRDDEFFRASSKAAEPVWRDIKSLYERVKDQLPTANEAQTEQLFIRPVLEILGYKDLYAVQPPAPSPEGLRRPDFAFFGSLGDKEEAEAEAKGKTEYFVKALAVGDAKQWDRSLDRKRKGAADAFTNANPSYQVDFYLRATDRKWALLTNGRRWRLYHRDTSYRMSVFYEVDLVALLDRYDETFAYFYAFFWREALSTGFLDDALTGSRKYAAKLGSELKENVYEALRLLAEGFLKCPENGLGTDDLEGIRANTFVLIYRILFLFYAEDRELLPLDKPDYRDSYSLRTWAREIAEQLDIGRSFSPTAYNDWHKLSELFRIVNEGDAYLGVPPYNGGLFDPAKHPLLAGWRIGDQYLARALDQLFRAEAAGRAGRGPVSYRDLDIRHLGSIYEGLLEHRLHLAREDVASVKEKDREVFVAVAELGNRRSLKTYKAGEVYLETDKGERKATGSYYTPDYIVKYIVENTLGPLVEEKRRLIEEERRNLEQEVTKARGYDREHYQRKLSELDNRLIEEILSIKVLDPAMGSGHFLVETVDYLARELIKAFGETPDEMEEEETRWARRQVVERCIYGVDVNPLAVELAKLSLWIETVAKDRPLSFLDHHLRLGNSLIGAWVKDLGMLPLRGKKDKRAEDAAIMTGGLFEGGLKKRLPTVIGEVMKLLRKPSDKVEDIREKEAIYERILTRLQPFKEIANVWVSTYFGNEVDEADYERALLKLSDKPPVWEGEVRSQPWFGKAQEITKERHFFNWELEFPEVFFEETGQRKRNPGFDAVIGNPPYDVVSEKEQQRTADQEKSFTVSSDVLAPALGGKLNIYRLFVASAIALLRQDGLHGFIVPMTLLGGDQARPLRAFILQTTSLRSVEAFPQKDDPNERVFFDAKLSTCVYTLAKSPPKGFVVRIHPGKDILSSSPSIALTAGDIVVFDPENLAIPCYPSMTTEDFRLAVRLASSCGSIRLGRFAPSRQGEVNLTTHADFLSDEPGGSVVLRGAHVDRYVLNDAPKQGAPWYLHVEGFLASRGTETKGFHHRHRRIGYQRGAAIDNWRRIIACVVEEGNFCSDTVNYVVDPCGLDLFTILALLNSALWEWRFRLTSTTNHVNAYEIDSLPIPQIALVTPQPERTRLAEEGKRLYREALERLGQGNSPEKHRKEGSE